MEEGSAASVNDLRMGQIVFIRAKVVVDMASQKYAKEPALMVELIDNIGRPVSHVQHGIEDRRAVLTMPEAVAAVGRMMK